MMIVNKEKKNCITFRYKYNFDRIFFLLCHSQITQTLHCTIQKKTVTASTAQGHCLANKTVKFFPPFCLQVFLCWMKFRFQTFFFSSWFHVVPVRFQFTLYEPISLCFVWNYLKKTLCRKCFLFHCYFVVCVCFFVFNWVILLDERTIFKIPYRK